MFLISGLNGERVLIVWLGNGSERRTRGNPRLANNKNGLTFFESNSLKNDSNDTGGIVADNTVHKDFLSLDGKLEVNFADVCKNCMSNFTSLERNTLVVVPEGKIVRMSASMSHLTSSSFVDSTSLAFVVVLSLL